jgi:hypothetical protein
MLPVTTKDPDTATTLLLVILKRSKLPEDTTNTSDPCRSPIWSKLPCELDMLNIEDPDPVIVKLPDMIAEPVKGNAPPEAPVIVIEAVLAATAAVTLLPIKFKKVAVP